MRDEAEKNPRHSRLIIDTYSFHHKAWGNISDCRCELGEYEDALRAAEKAASLRPDLPVYGITQARVLARMERFDDALDRLNAYEASNNTSVDFYLRYTALVRKHPELGEFADILRRGLDRYPGSNELRNCLAYSVLGEDDGLAEKEWKSVLATNPDHIGARVGLVKLCARDSRDADFARHADILLERAHTEDVLKEVGSLCLKMQMYPKAVDCFSRYLTLNPDDTNVLTDVATCYAKMGHYDAALLGYREVLKMHPAHPHIHENIRIVQRLMGAA